VKTRAVKPLIGITAYREQSRWGVWDEQADLLPAAYARSIEAAGGLAVLLPPTADPSGDTPEVVARLDGLVIAGGADVDPSRYTDVPHERTANWREDRDAWEFALLDAARATQLPVLGICHQSVATHPGLVASAHSADGNLEALEDPDLPFWLAVQWHPETQADTGLFAAFVAASAR
jgi:putative glutamine amidotransferase